MKTLPVIVALVGCSPGAPPPVANSGAPAAPAVAHRSFPGPRAVIEHKFLHAPISVANPSNDPIDVATATESIMLATIRFPGEAQLMLASDGTLDDNLGPPEAGKVVRNGADDTLVWTITQADDHYSFSAVRRGTGVVCAPYTPNVDAKLTMPQIEMLLDACRDIRLATAADASLPHYHGN